MPTQEEIWSAIDHRLVSLKLQRAVPERERETEKKRKEIYWRNRKNRNAATVPGEFFQLELEQTEKWIETVYRIYEDVWQKQGKERTPHFIRVVFRRAIVPVIQSRKECSSDFIRNHATRTAMFNLLGGQLAELERVASRLEDKWRQITEIVAIELEHSQEKRPKSRPHKKKKATRHRRSPTPSEARARTVARLIKELNVLKPQMHGESDYERLARENPRFLSFSVANRRGDLREKVISIQGHHRHIRLAQELAAAKYGLELSTVQTDWKRHKPRQFRTRKN